jgi:hypothetical protein
MALLLFLLAACMDQSPRKPENLTITLEAKADVFERRLQERHDHEGFIRSSEMTRPGDLTTASLPPSDNDGLWTSIYVAAEAFRYAVTKLPEARQRARRSMEAMMRLESVTGIPGFPARAMIRRGEFRHEDGVWRPSPDGVHEWKSDTSSDELVGHYFAFSVYYDFVAAEAEKPGLRAVVGRITQHLIEHNYTLVDWTGKPTLWAQYSAGYLKDHPDEQSLNRVLLLGHLLTAAHVAEGTPDAARFRAEYAKLIRQGYHLDVARYLETRTEINYSDEEMAMLGFYPLLRYEKDPKLRAVYLRGLDQWWQNERREKNPLWIAIRDACIGARENAADGEWSLRHIPTDTIEWTVTNSTRPDVVMDKDLERNGGRQAVTFLPPDERPVMKWNGNPFVVDGGNGGRSEDDGAFFLAPYWMGRYLGLWK